MAVLTTIPDNNYQPLSLVQEAGNLSFLLAEFERLFGIVSPPVEPAPTPAANADTGQFTAPSGTTYLVSYE